MSIHWRAIARNRAALLCALAVGCAAPARRVEVESSVERALLLPGSIEFRSEGDALDAPSLANGSTSSGDHLTFAHAIRRAVETDASLQAALARVRIAQADADVARKLPNPMLSLVFRIPEGGGQADVEAGLGADLLALLQRPRNARRADLRLESEAASALSVALDVVAATQRAYAEVQLLEELGWVLAQRGALLGRLREIARSRLELGEGARHELSSVDAELIQSEIEIGRRERELRVARLALARAIGEPSGAADWTVERWTAPEAPATTSVERWIACALQRRPELLAIEWELRAREAETPIARSQAFDGAGVGVEAERDGGWSIGPGASAPLPLFDAGGARAERARAATSEQSHRATEARRAIVEQVRAALERLAGARDAYARVVDELLPLQERRRMEIEQAHALGAADVAALLIAEQAMQQAHALRLELARALAAAHAELQRSVGDPSVFRSLAYETLEESTP